MLHGPRLRNRGGKCEFITVIIVNDHYGFEPWVWISKPVENRIKKFIRRRSAFDFHFVRRGPVSAGKRGEHNFVNLVQRCVKSFRDLGFKNGRGDVLSSRTAAR